MADLGLTAGPVRIVPKSYHQDIRADSFGPDVPAEVMAMLADSTIVMTLGHYDTELLDTILAESMGGAHPQAQIGRQGGILPPAGRLMGGGRAVGSSGNHFMTLRMTADVLSYPWEFPACYLAERPMELPVGTERSLALLNWRSIPYQPLTSDSATGGFRPEAELSSSGAVLWSHRL